MKPDFKHRRQSSVWHDNLSIPLVVTAICLYGSAAMAANAGSDDAYLKGLEEEVNLAEPAKGSSDAGKLLVLMKNAQIDPVNVKRFEQKLRKTHAGSYQFYKKLEVEDKLKVYREYEKNQDLSVTSDVILQLSFAHARRSR